MDTFLNGWRGLVALFGAAFLGFLLYLILFPVFRIVVKKTKTSIDDALIKHCRSPLRIIIPLLLIQFLLPVMDISPVFHNFIKQSFAVLMMAASAWFVIRLIYVLQDFIISHFNIENADNLKARQILTQFLIFKKIAIVLIIVFTFAIILMTFEKLRYLGTSILASAGIAGIIIGLAAQRSIGNLLAGLQVAITQPIRLDDVVIVEDEWGRIEEITLTYVVVRIWDLRRLILPISYFIEKPFQNWTRVTADILGTVFIYVDYAVPVNSVREKLHLILKESNLWDGKVWGLQVTNANEKTLELRALMSAPDASTAWNLRCEVREKLIDFIQKNYPYSLPNFRTQVWNSSKRH